jgi:hypothetical protein
MSNEETGLATYLKLAIFNLQRIDESLQKIQNKLNSGIEIKKKIIVIDCKNLRDERRDANIREVFTHIINKDKDAIINSCNKKELHRQMLYLELDYDTLLQECNNIYFAKVLASHIAINASRQGTKDESFVLNQCNITTKTIGIHIQILSNTAYRPTKDGRIITHVEYQPLKKHECLKSFDAKITGKINGWIFAKITYANGGHQGNVFEEAYQMCEWVKSYQDPTHLYVILIDTDLDKLFYNLRDHCKKYQLNNLIVVDHIELQRYMLIHYS